ncbi:MAG: archaeosortase H N-terminal-like domain-containing protein [Promethearchaeota archaeon]
MEQITIKKLFIWILLSINLLFSFIIGWSIPQMETKNSYIFGLVMIPLLIILNYIILDRFHFFVNKFNEKEEKIIAKKANNRI